MPMEHSSADGAAPEARAEGREEQFAGQVPVSGADAASQTFPEGEMGGDEVHWGTSPLTSRVERAARRAQRARGSDEPDMPAYASWTLEVYRSSPFAEKRRFWEDAPMSVQKRMSACLLELRADNSLLQQAQQKGWLVDEHLR